MPSARAPSMSSSYESPTITASAAATPSAARAVSKIEACGFVRPWLLEPTATSTSRRVMSRELLEVALPVRDQADAEPVVTELVEHGERIVVEVEVGVDLPAAHHVGRACPRAVGVAAHAADDVLGERDPDLLVVHELGVRPQIVEGREPCRLVAAGIEAEPVSSPRDGTPRARARARAERA